MKRLMSYLKHHPVITLLAPLFKMLEATFELFIPLVVARMIDIGIAGKNPAYLWKMGGLMILLGIIGFTFSLTAQYFAAKSAIFVLPISKELYLSHFCQSTTFELSSIYFSIVSICSSIYCSASLSR